MENMYQTKSNFKLNTVALALALMVSNNGHASENDKAKTQEDAKVEKALAKDAESSQERLEDRRGRGRYKKVTLSEDKTYYTIDGKEELGPNPVDGEKFYVKYSKKKYEDYYSDFDDDEDEKGGRNYRFRSANDRDGFYLAYSAVSSSGDDFHQLEESSDAAFDTHFSYRIQIASLFVESPGLNSRRLHGLYASNAWGINFYNSDNWSFDIYKQTDTERVEGLEHIQTRNKGRRAGIRATGYFDNSQLQFIYSPYSDADFKDDGIEASLSYTHYWQIKNWNVYGSLGAQYQSEEIVDYYQPGMQADQSRINTSAELGLEYALNEHWVLGAFASYNELPSRQAEVNESTSGSRAGILLTFVF